MGIHIVQGRLQQWSGGYPMDMAKALTVIHTCYTGGSREAVLAAVKVKGQARLVHLVSTITGALSSSSLLHALGVSWCTPPRAIQMGHWRSRA